MNTFWPANARQYPFYQFHIHFFGFGGRRLIWAAVIFRFLVKQTAQRHLL